MQRLQRLTGHVAASVAPELVAQPTAAISGATPADDDVVICFWDTCDLFSPLTMGSCVYSLLPHILIVNGGSPPQPNGNSKRVFNIRRRFLSKCHVLGPKGLGSRLQALEGLR